MSANRLFYKPADGFKIFLKPNIHDVIMRCRWNDEKLFPLCSHMAIQVFGFFEGDKRIVFAVDDERRDMNLLDHLHAFPVDPFQWCAMDRYPEMPDDPDHAGKTALNDEAPKRVLVSTGKLDCGDASQGSSHGPKDFIT